MNTLKLFIYFLILLANCKLFIIRVKLDNYGFSLSIHYGYLFSFDFLHCRYIIHNLTLLKALAMMDMLLIPAALHVFTDHRDGHSLVIDS